MSESDKTEAAGQGHVFTPDDTRLFRDALGRFATGVAVVTAREEGGVTPVGITVNSFASVSLDPPLVLWSVARSSARHRHFVSATAFAIHVLRADQIGLAKRFTGSGAGFEGLDLRFNAADVPLIDPVLARFECVTEAMHEGGDHTIIIGRVTHFSLSLSLSQPPLCFFAGGFGDFEPRP